MKAKLCLTCPNYAVADSGKHYDICAKNFVCGDCPENKPSTTDAAYPRPPHRPEWKTSWKDRLVRENHNATLAR